VTIRRCAIYTRKSSEEGLEQSFNSLDAQREACAAYIQSQKGEGWKALPTHYDDGGYSGGTMERPALSTLLQDIAVGRIDVVVVYKVDRLTRALADFAKIVEVFDRHGVSFVSVTQAFNTTSSMGRLTLNVLLSFAQFEREVTGERIRDKIAASKAKGMWMGGQPPLGYEVKDRKLIVVPGEAETVRNIFQRYLALKSVTALAGELKEHGIASKIRLRQDGAHYGGRPFSRGALFHLLRNRIYVGDIVHKEHCYAGAHDAIVEVDVFEKVQRQLTTGAVQRRTSRSQSAPLRGRVFDAFGNRMTPCHAYGKLGRKYRYYVSIATAQRQDPRPDHVSRVSANPLEELVLDRVRRLLRQPNASWPEVTDQLGKVEVRAASVALEVKAPEELVGPDTSIDATTITRISDTLVRLETRACMLPRKGTIAVSSPAARIRRAHFNRPLIAALRRAHRELANHGIGTGRGEGLDQARGLPDPYLRRIATLAFLAPDIQQSILAGRQPAGLSLKRLTETELPLHWREQRFRLGFSDP
jgi:DNA invertase Pin-like site-specific DNA recombinase